MRVKLWSRFTASATERNGPDAARRAGDRQRRSGLLRLARLARPPPGTARSAPRGAPVPATDARRPRRPPGRDVLRCHASASRRGDRPRRVARVGSRTLRPALAFRAVPVGGELLLPPPPRG